MSCIKNSKNTAQTFKSTKHINANAVGSTMHTKIEFQTMEVS